MLCMHCCLHACSCLLPGWALADGCCCLTPMPVAQLAAFLEGTPWPMATAVPQGASPLLPQGNPQQHSPSSTRRGLKVQLQPQQQLLQAELRGRLGLSARERPHTSTGLAPPRPLSSTWQMRCGNKEVGWGFAVVGGPLTAAHLVQQRDMCARQRYRHTRPRTAVAGCRRLAMECPMHLATPTCDSFRPGSLARLDNIHSLCASCVVTAQLSNPARPGVRLTEFVRTAISRLARPSSASCSSPVARFGHSSWDGDRTGGAG